MRLERNYEKPRDWNGTVVLRGSWTAKDGHWIGTVGDQEAENEEERTAEFRATMVAPSAKRLVATPQNDAEITRPLYIGIALTSISQAHNSWPIETHLQLP